MSRSLSSLALHRHFLLYFFILIRRRDSCEIVVAARARARERGCYHLCYKHLIFRGVDSYPSGKAGTSPRARLSHPVICATWRTLRATREPRVVIPPATGRAVDPGAPIRRKGGSQPSCKRKYNARSWAR